MKSGNEITEIFFLTAHLFCKTYRQKSVKSFPKFHHKMNLQP